MADQLFDRERLIWTRPEVEVPNDRNRPRNEVSGQGPSYVVNGDWMTVLTMMGTSFEVRLNNMSQADLNTTLHEAGLHRGEQAGGCAECWAL